MLKYLTAQTAYKLTAGIISHGDKIATKIFPNKIYTNLSPLASDVIQFGKKEIVPYHPIVIPKLEPHQIGELEGLSEDDFIIKAQEIIAKILNMPQELKPNICVFPDLGKNTSARYSCTQHQIELPYDFFEESSRKQFATLAHEMKHAEQNIAILRNPELSANAIKYYSQHIPTQSSQTKYIIQPQETIKNENDLIAFRNKILE